MEDLFDLDETVTLTLTREEAARLTNLAGEESARWVPHESESAQKLAKLYADLESKIRDQRMR